MDHRTALVEEVISNQCQPIERAEAKEHQQRQTEDSFATPVYLHRVLQLDLYCYADEDRGQSLEQVFFDEQDRDVELEEAISLLHKAVTFIFRCQVPYRNAIFLHCVHYLL